MMIRYGTSTSATRQQTTATMKRPLHLTGSFIASLLLTTTITTTIRIQPAVAQTFTRAAACENEPALIGYSNITDLNDDMMTELDRIAGGGQVPADAYNFVLCPGVTFDMRGPTPLLPVLSQANFACGGPDSVPPVECILDGSEQQILMQDSTIPDYVPSFTMTGVIFDRFRRGMSAELRASSPSVARFVDCTWREFDADFIMALNSNKPMTIEIINGVISGENEATARDGFRNPGGIVMIDGLNVTGARFDGSLISTNGGGEAMLKNAFIATSYATSITSTFAGSTLIENVTVTNMEFIQDAFRAETADSTQTVNNLFFSNNANAGSSAEWTGILVQGGATGSVTRSTFESNQAIQYVVVAKSVGELESTLTVEDSSFSNNIGRFGTSAMSGVVGVVGNIDNFEIGSSVDVLRVSFTGNSGFMANVVGAFGGEFNVRQTCFTSNSNILALFSATGGTFVAQNNSASDELSTLCQIPGNRAASETSGCFTPGGTCLVDCLPGADDSETCLAQVILTEEPSAIVTEAPSVVPSTLSLSALPTLSLTTLQTSTPTDTSTELFSNPPSSSPTDLPSSAASVASNMPQSESQSESPSRTQLNFTSMLPANFPTVLPVGGGPTTSPSPAPTLETTLLPQETLAPTVTVSPTGDLTFSPGPVPFPSRPQPPMSNIATMLLPRPPTPNIAPMLLPSTRRPVRPSPNLSPSPRPPQSGCSPDYYDDRNGRHERGGSTYLKPNKLAKYRFKRKHCDKKYQAKKTKKAKESKSKKKKTKKKKPQKKKSTNKNPKGQQGKDGGNAKFHGIFGGGEGHVELSKKKGYWGPLGGAQGAYRDHHMGIIPGGRQGMNHADGNAEHPLARWNVRDYQVADEKGHKDEIELAIVGGRRTLQHLLQERRQQATQGLGGVDVGHFEEGYDADAM